MFTTTALFAALLALIYLFLSVNVIRNRVRHGVALGDGDHQAVKLAIRAHGNFAEYTPFFLILLALLESLSTSKTLMIALGVAFILGRVSHAYSLCRVERYEAGNLASTLKFRQIGMFLTFGSYGILAVALLAGLIVAN